MAAPDGRQPGSPAPDGRQPEQAAAAPPVEELPRHKWLLSDSSRGYLVTAIVVVVAVVVTLVLVLASGFGRESMSSRSWAWLRSLAIWAGFAGVHARLTWHTFGRLTGARLAAGVRYERRKMARRSRLSRWLWTGGDSPSYAVSMAGLALIGVIALMANGDLRQDANVQIAAAALVAMSWLDVLVTYAVHYARLDEHQRIVRFADDHERTFTDYLYLAVMVQTTFGVTDVALRDSRARAAVIPHSLLAFGCNTVLIAMMVALGLSS